MDLSGGTCCIIAAAFIVSVLVLLKLMNRPTGRLLGEFTIEHYPDTREVTFRSNLNGADLGLFYLYYFDKQVANCGAAAIPLFDDVFRIAGSFLAGMVDGQIPSPDEAFQGLQWRVVEHPSGHNPIVFTGKFMENSPYGIWLKVPLTTHTQIEPVAAGGVLALYEHVHRTLEKDGIFLSIGLVGACNWYQENGMPGPTQVRKAATAGLASMAEVVQRLPEDS